MSAELRSPNGSMIVRGFILAAIAVTVVGAQVGFPWLSFHFAGALAEGAYREDEPASWSDYCSARMRFNSFFDPDSLPFRGVIIRSATVYKDELIVLANNGLNIDSTQPPTDLIRFNLRTGNASTSPAPEGVRYVLSDGNRLWWLPEDKDVRDPPWILDDHPTALVSHYPLYQFVDFIDGCWQKSDRFALIPPRSGPFDAPTFWPSTTANSFLQVESTLDRLIFRIGFEVGTKEQALQFAERFWNPTNDELKQVGYRFISSTDEDTSFLRLPFGRWLEGGVLCAMDYTGDHRGDSVFRWDRYEPGKPIESRFVPTPIRWGIDPFYYGKKLDGLTAITSVDGRVYILSHDDSDGRLHVLQWENGQLRLVAQRGDPYFRRVCLDGGLLFSLVCIIPMLLLAFLAFLLQRNQAGRLFAYGRESVVLASVARRGIARSVDLGLVVLPLVLSVAMHPDAIGWWRRTSDESRHLFEAIDYFEFVPVVDSLQACRDALQTNLFALLSAPILWWVFVIGVAVGVAQLLWQGRSGRTLGKWLMGIKVVRTTLRPCGLARSLLREILLLIDSVMLFSWVTGVITILATSRSQRVGDLIADTIVIRNA